MKILTILGARPQFIKAANISREIAQYNSLQEIIVHTGQHFDINMSEIFFQEMHIPKPNHFLGIHGKSHGAMTGQMMEQIELVANQEQPDLILVYGDTNSTLAGALVASKLHIKLAHIEAGLRSFNRAMPEEINRILTDRVSDILFCPTNEAVLNLQQEGFDHFDCDIIQCGDVMLDGAMYYKQFAVAPEIIPEEKFVLCTIHRAENTNDIRRLEDILSALVEIANEMQVILPLHPRTRQIIEREKFSTGSIVIVPPIGYLQMIWLLQKCEIVITDSGGLQKEAYFFAKHCITLREETEWVELVASNLNILAGSNKKRILDIFSNHAFSENFDDQFYGSGESSKKIVEYLSKI